MTAFETDALEIFERFSSFTIKEMDKAVNSALVKGAKVIQKEAKKNLRTRLPKSTVRNVTKYKDTLVDAVRIGKKKKGKENESMVHIMGTRDQYSGTFRAKFFETGLSDMSRKYNGKTIFGGEIKPLHFFKDAVVSTKDEVVKTIEETLVNKINEINDKKYS